MLLFLTVTVQMTWLRKGNNKHLVFMYILVQVEDIILKCY